MLRVSSFPIKGSWWSSNAVSRVALMSMHSIPMKNSSFGLLKPLGACLWLHATHFSVQWLIIVSSVFDKLAFVSLSLVKRICPPIKRVAANHFCFRPLLCLVLWPESLGLIDWVGHRKACGRWSIHRQHQAKDFVAVDATTQWNQASVSSASDKIGKESRIENITL